MTIGSLFTGIGGIDLGLQMAGLGPVLWHCEADPAARAVLSEHFPGVPCYNDIKDIDASAARPTVICGGFPCQPHSVAGRRQGTADSRWLWPEFARVVESLRPAAVFIENVPGLRTTGLRDVLADLASLGFDAEWDCFTAAEVGAPHLRRRLFVLAHADGQGQLQPSRCLGDLWGRAGNGGEPLANADSTGLAQRLEQPARGEREATERGGLSANTWAAEPDVGRVAHGIPARVDRLRLLGNACVPQQAAHAWVTLAARARAARRAA